MMLSINQKQQVRNTKKMMQFDNRAAAVKSRGLGRPLTRKEYSGFRKKKGSSIAIKTLKYDGKKLVSTN